MHGYPYRARLVSYSSCYSLAYPPRCISRKLVALSVIKLFNRFYKAKVAFLYKVKEEHAAADIALCNAYHEPEVGFRKLLLGFLIPVGHALCKLYLLLRAQKRHLAYLLKVHSNGVVYRYPLTQGSIVFTFRYLIIYVFGYVNFLFHHVYIERFKPIVQLFYLVAVHIKVAQCIHNLFIGQYALSLASVDQLVNFAFLRFLRFQSSHPFCLICVKSILKA